MPRTRTIQVENCIQCRHHFDKRKIDALSSALRTLPENNPDLLRSIGVAPADFPLYFRSAIESIRGVFAASSEEKKRFLKVIFDQMKATREIREWDFVGSKGRQDYRITLPSGTLVCIEAKGCPDGNNMTIWERPSWAEEFIVWSQCPDSLQHQPGHGIWSGIATRLVPKMLTDGQPVDAFVFYDGRCGSEQRRCPKTFGLTGNARGRATDVPGQSGREWLPPPSIYLFPRTVPHPQNNKTPALHDLKSCSFANHLLATFKVPPKSREAMVNWARVSVKATSQGTFVKVALGNGLKSTPSVEGDFKRLRRE